MEPLDVPPHLRELVVQQDYEQYTEVDQAVWRFVVMHAHRRLCQTAHPAYEKGFEDAGIRVDRIPRITEMSEQLARFGWRAVCVDGFIPPRAFVAFQARGVLPIAADMRRVEHLAYTPAPDIVHEAAGHAPLLVHPAYGRFIRRIGEVGERAFSNRADAELYAAIYTLSEVKEDRDSTPEQVARAQEAVLAAQRALGAPSEAAKLARLYWWTAEYGLVGTPDDYRLYGAGLLSSLGEGHFCNEPSVRKLALSADCIEVDYDITRAQPQLFVARSFEQLDDVLERVASGLSQRRGGRAALQAAVASEQLASVQLDSGAELTGVVRAVHHAGGEPAWIELEGRSAFGRRGVLVPGLPEAADGMLQPLGVREDGTPLSALTQAALARSLAAGGTLAMRLHNGLVLRGQHLRSVIEDGRVLGLVLARGEIALGQRVLSRFSEPRVIALGTRVTTAVPYALAGYHAETAFSNKRVPKARTLSERERALLELYERALEAFRSRAGSGVAVQFAQIADALDARFADDWLLRFNLLESLTKLGEDEALAGKLERELERLEIRFAHREPIATGLRYVRALAGSRSVQDEIAPAGQQGGSA